VPSDLTTGERIPDIRLRPLFSGRRDDARPFLEAAGCQRDIGGDAYVDGSDVLYDPIVSRVSATPIDSLPSGEKAQSSAARRLSMHQP
jgi:hypothetical protein